MTLIKVKADCLLFKQMKLSIKEKERNLRSLIDSQLDFKTLADLEAAIVGSSNVEEQSNVEDEDGANLELRNDADQQANQDDVHSMWPPNEEQFIIGSFTEVIGDTVHADFLLPATVLKMEKGESLWKRPLSDQRENHILVE